MRFREEVRRFMQEIRLVLGKKEVVVQEQSRMILVLQEQNRDLLNRLMARDYPELATYTAAKYKEEGEVDLDFTQNEELAGAVVDPDTGEEVE